MSKQHGPRQQKKLAKQKAKRTARHKELARQTSSDPMVRLKSADRWPIVATLVPRDLWETGIGQLVFARRMPGGQLACGMFLADVFCLGIKDTYWRIVLPSEFEDLKHQVAEQAPLDSVSPEYFSKLVHQTADYGQSLGFPPHHDFRHVRLLLAGIDPSLCHDEFTFGKDGKPYYMRGPSESRDRARFIGNRVRALGGHYAVGLTPDELFPESDFGDMSEELRAALEAEFSRQAERMQADPETWTPAFDPADFSRTRGQIPDR